MEIEAFGEEEANDVIGILVRTALPGLMGLSKIDKGIEQLLNLTEICKLRAVVQTDAFDWEPMKQRCNYSSCFIGISAGDITKLQVSGLTIHQRNQQAFPNSTVDRIAFPVANPAAESDFFRPLRDYTIRLDGVKVGFPGDKTLSATSKVGIGSNSG